MEQYDIGAFLGKGSFASVYLARAKKSRRKVAIKIVDLADFAGAADDGGVGAGADVVEHGGASADVGADVGASSNSTEKKEEQSDDSEDLDVDSILQEMNQKSSNENPTNQLNQVNKTNQTIQRKIPATNQSNPKTLTKRSNQANEKNEKHGETNETVMNIRSIIQREIVIHTSVSTSYHPNIVSLIDSFDSFDTIDAFSSNTTTKNAKMALVMEYCSGGDLQGYLKRVRDHRRNLQHQHYPQQASLPSANQPPSMPIVQSLLSREGTFLLHSEIQHALSQLLSALSFLHSRGIVHRDVKASNIFLCPLPSDSSQSCTSQSNDDALSATTSTSAPAASLPSQLSQLSQLPPPPPLTAYELKLGDFGLAVQMDEDVDWYEAQSTLCGTPSCLAPEVVKAGGAGSSSGDGGTGGTGGVGSTGMAKTKSNFDDLDGVDGMDAIDEMDEMDEMDSLLMPHPQQRDGSGQLSGCQKCKGYGQPADLWSAGCVLYTLIAGSNPFALPPPSQQSQPRPSTQQSQQRHHQSEQSLQQRRIQETISRVIQNEWHLPHHIEPRVSSSMKELLYQLLEVEPRKRGTARSLVSFHSFFRSSNCGLTKLDGLNEFNELEGVNELCEKKEFHEVNKKKEVHEELNEKGIVGQDSKAMNVSQALNANSDVEESNGKEESGIHDIFNHRNQDDGSPSCHSHHRNIANAAKKMTYATNTVDAVNAAACSKSGLYELPTMSTSSTTFGSASSDSLDRSDSSHSLDSFHDSHAPHEPHDLQPFHISHVHHADPASQSSCSLQEPRASQSSYATQPIQSIHSVDAISSSQALKSNQLSHLQPPYSTINHSQSLDRQRRNELVKSIESLESVEENNVHREMTNISNRRHCLNQHQSRHQSRNSARINTSESSSFQKCHETGNKKNHERIPASDLQHQTHERHQSQQNNTLPNCTSLYPSSCYHDGIPLDKPHNPFNPSDYSDGPPLVPLKELHRLPIAKYQWKEVRKRRAVDLSERPYGNQCGHYGRHGGRDGRDEQHSQYSARDGREEQRGRQDQHDQHSQHDQQGPHGLAGQISPFVCNESSYSVYFLGTNGIVIQREEKQVSSSKKLSSASNGDVSECNGDNGLWMHLTSDGMKVFCGDIHSPHSQPLQQQRQQNQHSNQRCEQQSDVDANEEQRLLIESFLRAPKELGNDTRLRPTLHPSSPIMSVTERQYYKPISFFTSSSCSSAHTLAHSSLHTSHGDRGVEYLALYKTLERVVRSVKECTPKLTLHLYTRRDEFATKNHYPNHSNLSTYSRRSLYSNSHNSPSISYNSNNGMGLFAKTMLMENEHHPLADTVTCFVDGTTIRISLSKARLTIDTGNERRQCHHYQKTQEELDGNPSNQSILTFGINSKIFLSQQDGASMDGSCCTFIIQGGTPMTKQNVSQKDASLLQFRDHIQMARVASLKCLELEQRAEQRTNDMDTMMVYGGKISSGSSNYPLLKNVMVHGWDRNFWTVLDNIDFHE